MRFEEYYITDKEGNSNCLIRSLCRIYNKEYEEVFGDLCSLAKELKCENFNDIEVFETYMKKHNTFKIDYGKDIKIKDLKLEDGNYIVFAFDKKDWYHIVNIENNVLYDSEDDSLELYVISIYKKN